MSGWFTAYLLVKVKVSQLCPTLCDPMDYTVHGILQARILEWVAFPFSRGSSQPRDPTQVSHTTGEFFTSSRIRPPGKPKNTGVGNLSLLQRIFLTQELNRDPRHCRRILYQLSYQGSRLEGHPAQNKCSTHIKLSQSVPSPVHLFLSLL